MSSLRTFPPYDRDRLLLQQLQADTDTLRWQVVVCPRLEVVLGRGSRPELELNLAALARDDVPVLRRQGGGCAVVLDPGNVVVSVVERLPGIGGSRAAFTRISSWLCRALARSGIAGVEQRGISDLALRERKVGGACIHRTRGLLHYSTTLLWEPDLEQVERYLLHPPREPDYRRGRSHRDFLGRLCEERSECATIAEFAAALATGLEEVGR